MDSAAPFLVTEIEAAQLANSVALKISESFLSENPKAPRKQSPAPTVSIASTFRDSKYFVSPSEKVTTPSEPSVTISLVLDRKFKVDIFF